MDYRRPTREVASPQTASDSDHGWHCWETLSGPGFRLRAHVDDVEKNMTQQINGVATEFRTEVAAINKRGWYQSGGIMVGTTIALLVLGAWITTQFKSAAEGAVKRADVEQAIKRSAEMATAKAVDDAGLYKQMLDRAAVDVSLPDVRAAKTKGK